jgi:hypothetical protein
VGVEGLAGVDLEVVDMILCLLEATEKPASSGAATGECGSVWRWAARLGPRSVGRLVVCKPSEERRKVLVPVVMVEDSSLPAADPVSSSAPADGLGLLLVAGRLVLARVLS